MGLPKKHALQLILETRLLLIAGAPWKNIMPISQAMSRSSGVSQATLAIQASLGTQLRAGEAFTVMLQRCSCTDLLHGACA